MSEKMVRQVMLALCLGCVHVFACAQIPRSHELICRLPDGGTFILKSSYVWYGSPFGHSSGEEKNKPYEIYFQPKGSKRKIKTGDEFPYVPLVEGNPQGLCANIGLVGGLAQAGLELYRPDGEKFTTVDISTVLSISDSEREQPEPYRSQLKQAGLDGVGDRYTTFIERQGVLVMESALFRMDQRCGNMPAVPNPCPIGGVLRSESHDLGKTWSKLEFRTSSEIFTIGKSILEQSFIARPVSVNGKDYVSGRRR